MTSLIGEVTGYGTPAVVTSRRPGDPARVVASAERIGVELGWAAKRDVREMVASAWEGWRGSRAV
ncbi:UDP-glucose 4-epimerase OS=Streptomyces alboniger OX=132473 GN=galE PE=3 SV=1 [Streptomyces alboniger]